MPAKRRTKASAQSTEIAGQGELTLVEVARTIGSTFGTAVAKAEGAAKEIETATQSAAKSTLTVTRKFYKRAKKQLRARAARWKSGAKKSKAVKRKSRKSPGRGK